MIIVVLDACVLYPPSVRDLLMWLATVRIYAPRFTEEIHEEWIRNVLADNPHVSPTLLDRTRLLMNQAVPGCLVTGHQGHIPSLTLPDKDDRHVLAAAIEAKAAEIITYNLSDFPDSALRAHNVRAVHPDTFLCGLFQYNPQRFLRGVKAHRASLINPSKDPSEYIETLRANRLVELAFTLEEAADNF